MEDIRGNKLNVDDLVLFSANDINDFIIGQITKFTSTKMKLRFVEAINPSCRYLKYKDHLRAGNQVVKITVEEAFKIIREWEASLPFSC